MLRIIIIMLRDHYHVKHYHVKHHHYHVKDHHYVNNHHYLLRKQINEIESKKNKIK